MTIEATQTDAIEATQTDAETSIEDRLEGLLNEDSADEVFDTDEAEDVISEDAPEDDAVNEIELDAAQLAQMHGLNDEDISIDEDGNITFKTNIDGEIGRANLKDLIKSYQLEGHVNKKSMEIGAQQQKLSEQVRQTRQNLDIQLQQSSALLGAAEQQLLNEYNSIPWGNLRMTDPGEFAAKQAEFNSRNTEIQQLKQNAIVTYQQQQQQVEYERQQRQAQFEAIEREKLYNAIPEWRDEKVAKQEKQEIVDYMQSRGYPPEMIAGVSQYHLAVEDVRKLAKMANSDTESKKIIKKPKAVLKPGSNATQTNADQRKAEAKRNKFRKSGSVDDLASALIDRI